MLAGAVTEWWAQSVPREEPRDKEYTLWVFGVLCPAIFGLTPLEPGGPCKILPPYLRGGDDRAATRLYSWDAQGTQWHRCHYHYYCYYYHCYYYLHFYFSLGYCYFDDY